MTLESISSTMEITNGVDPSAGVLLQCDEIVIADQISVSNRPIREAEAAVRITALTPTIQRIS